MRRELTERRGDLQNLKVEILMKFFIAFQSIPHTVLSRHYPDFRSNSCIKLHDLYRHVEAKLRLVRTYMSRLDKKKDDDNNYDDDDDDNNYDNEKTSESVQNAYYYSISDAAAGDIKSRNTNDIVSHTDPSNLPVASSDATSKRADDDNNDNNNNDFRASSDRQRKSQKE